MHALWSKPSPDLGAKLETVIFLHLIAKGEEIYYLRDRSCEVDFCLVRGGKPDCLIQVCYDLASSKTRAREIKALVELGDKYNVARTVIVTRDLEDEIHERGRKLEVVPVYRFLLEEM